MYLLLIAILCVSVIMGCSEADSPTPPTAPTLISTNPADSDMGSSVNSIISAVFSEAMDPATIIAANFTLAAGVTPVTGIVTYDLPNKTAKFAPVSNLDYNTTYTATITTGVEDIAGNALAANEVWTFSTDSQGSGPAPVNLGTAGNYAILAKTAISTVPSSAITGDIGISPAAETYITGFSQTDATGYATSTQVTGFIYASDMAPPTPSNLTTAISNMETAYTDAAGRPTPNYTDLGSGNIGGETLDPGLYNWGGTVTIPSNVTISGNSNDVWIFQVAGDLTVSGSVNVTLSGGALAKNIFWQVAGEVTVGTNSHFEGIILCQTAITLATNASMNGRILAQTQVALDQNAVTVPVE